MKKYNPNQIEKKWQKYWFAKKLFFAKDHVAGRDNFMLLTEFPYPSGNLHIGHWYAFAVPDILARYLRMSGKNVMYPIGFDAFGLPAENAAIKNDLQPSDWTKKNISYMTKQLHSMGASFDWLKQVSTTDPEYYKWTQWIFIQFFKKGLAYRAKTLVNWCPKDRTVLANEQVVNGCCDRCGTEVVQKEITQWMFKITDYAQRLIDDLGKVDWPQATKIAQKNWIGRSEGAEINFLVPNSKELLRTFTTRADTLFGATYLVLAPEHPMVLRLTADQQLGAVNKYLSEVKKKSEHERLNLEKNKTGVFTGGYAVNPINNEKVPVWIADYVVGHYGTGAVMAVPAHDERDFEFAKKYQLPIKTVVVPLPGMARPSVARGEGGNFADSAFVEDGILVDSAEFTGYRSEDAREEIVEKLAAKKLALRKINYKLHDWVISRQRYWGVPIPMVHCAECGYQPVEEKELPVKLPKLEDYKPTSDGRSPLAKATDWLKTKCSKCGREAERETDTMDTFVDSSWYFLRYADPKNKKRFADADKVKKWLPTPLYIGGAEHNTMHLLYSRFFTKALFDLELLEFDEPFLVRRNHGVILGPNSQKMSKSKGNVVDPDDLVKEYGADAVRMYLAFMGPYDQGGPWDPKGINGIFRFLNRIWNFLPKVKATSRHLFEPEPQSRRPELEVVLNKAVKKVGEDIKDLHFNTAVSELMKLSNEFESHGQISKDIFRTFLKLLAPFAPHLAEEIWMKALRHKSSVHLEKWPKFNSDLAQEEKVSLIVQVNGKTRDLLSVTADIDQEQAEDLVLGLEKVKKHLAGKPIRKVIYVKNRLINLVA